MDVYQTDIPYLDQDVLACWDLLGGGCAYGDLPHQEQMKLKMIDDLVEQFLEADKYVYVIVTPLWNLSVPPRLKAYIDCVCIVGKTFRYTEQGPEGLLRGKQAIHIQARGGEYSQPPMLDYEFGDKYLKAILGFMGIETLNSVIVEGMLQHPQETDEILEQAKIAARKAAVSFAHVAPGLLT